MRPKNSVQIIQVFTGLNYLVLQMEKLLAHLLNIFFNNI